MTLLAEDDTRAILARLKDAIRDTGHSLRGIARATDELGLKAPEKVSHSNLSEHLRNMPGRHMGLQMFLTVCKIIEVPPTQVIAGEVAGLAAEAVDRLPASERAEVLRDLEARLSAHRGTSELRRRIQLAAQKPQQRRGRRSAD